jgi:hypothetical protein
MNTDIEFQVLRSRSPNELLGVVVTLITENESRASQLATELQRLYDWRSRLGGDIALSVVAEPAPVCNTEMMPGPVPVARRTRKTAVAATPLSDQIALFLDAMGPQAEAAIARYLRRDSVSALLTGDCRFHRDERGFWDLRVKYEARQARDIQPGLVVCW